jgi:hypothetical protein
LHKFAQTFADQPKLHLDLHGTSAHQIELGLGPLQVYDPSEWTHQEYLYPLFDALVEQIRKILPEF